MIVPISFLTSLLLVAPQFGGGDKARTELFLRAEGSDVRAALQVEIEPRWHLYHVELGGPGAVGKPTTVALSGDGVAWSEVRFPEPHRFDQPGLAADGGDTWIWGHEGTIVLYARGTLEDGANLEDVQAEIDGLTCKESCIPYFQTVASSGAGPDALFADFPGDLAPPGEASEPVAEPRAPPTTPEPGGRVDDDSTYDAASFVEYAPRGNSPDHGLATWLVLAFIAGMILNVMPCVLPVISIKVLSFVQQSGEDRRRVFQLGLAFAAGILVVFLGLAAVAISLGLGWGEQFQSQEFLVVMIGIVFALALSLFGVYELGVPAGVGSSVGIMREGLGDAFFKGMLATLLATPCSGPFLGSTLTWTLDQPALTVLAVFGMLGLGMAFPYVVLTANPRLLKILPRPGAWMETFKQAMGFVLLLTVVYLMISLEQDLMLFTTAFLVFVALGCWWYGRFATLGKARPKRLAHLALAFAIVGVGGQFSFGSFRSLFDTGAPGDDHLYWERFEPDRLAHELEQGRSVFVDFTADWCPNCKYNEVRVYDSEPVRELLREKDVLVLKADITHNSAYTRMTRRLMEKLGAKSIPFMAVFPADDPLRPFVRLDVVTRNDVAGILASLPDPP